MHSIAFLLPAERYFKKLKEKGLKEVFRRALNQLRENPYLGIAERGDLAGIYGYDVYYKGTNYELAYMIVGRDDGLTIVIIMAGTRENFYEQLKHYL